MRKERLRRRLSMTSLIDVIFLLLLFFMLSSTFTRFAEVDLATAGGGGAASAAAPVFLTLSPDALRVNGADSTLADLPGAVSPLLNGAAPLSVLISLRGDVTAQRLTDVLAALHGMAGLRVTVLGAT